MKLFAKMRDRHATQRQMVESGTNQSLRGYWLCGDYFPRKKPGVHYFYYHKYMDYRTGDELTLPKTKYGYPVYRVLGWSKNTWGDHASFDDGRKYDLEFVRFSDKPLKPSKEIMAR